MKSNCVFFATVFLGCLLFAVGYPDGYPSGSRQVELSRSYGPPAPDREIQPQYYTPRLIQYVHNAPARVTEPTYHAPSRIIQSSYTAPFTSTSPVIQSVYGPPAQTRERRSTFDTSLSSGIIRSSYGAPSAGRLELSSTYGIPAPSRVSAPTYEPPSAGRLELTPTHGTPAPSRIPAPTYGAPAPPLIQDSTYRAPSRAIQSTYGAPQRENIKNEYWRRTPIPTVACDGSIGGRYEDYCPVKCQFYADPPSGWICEDPFTSKSTSTASYW